MRYLDIFRCPRLQAWHEHLAIFAPTASFIWRTIDEKSIVYLSDMVLGPCGGAEEHPSIAKRWRRFLFYACFVRIAQLDVSSRPRTTYFSRCSAPNVNLSEPSFSYVAAPELLSFPAFTYSELSSCNPGRYRDSRSLHRLCTQNSGSTLPHHREAPRLGFAHGCLRLWAPGTGFNLA